MPINEFQPESRYLELDGVYVETARCARKCLYVFLCSLLLVVIGGKFFWGSWEVMFGAGSFIIALPMLVLMVFSYHDVKSLSKSHQRSSARLLLSDLTSRILSRVE